MGASELGIEPVLRFTGVYEFEEVRSTGTSTIRITSATITPVFLNPII